MRRDNWPVGDYGIRPAGSPSHCFYCQTERGGQHKAGCVIRSRTVVLSVTIDLVVSVPEQWDKDMIEFHRNEGSWCAANVVKELMDQVDRMGCLCGSAEFSYVREATPEDEERFDLTVEGIPS